MRIQCPFCGERDLSEFTYLGDGGVPRRDHDAAGAAEQLHEATHLRENPAGQHKELWYHTFACRSWLRVTRDTRTHEIFAVELCKEVAS